MLQNMFRADRPENIQCLPDLSRCCSILLEPVQVDPYVQSPDPLFIFLQDNIIFNSCTEKRSLWNTHCSIS